MPKTMTPIRITHRQYENTARPDMSGERKLVLDITEERVMQSTRRIEFSQNLINKLIESELIGTSRS